MERRGFLNLTGLAALTAIAQIKGKRQIEIDGRVIGCALCGLVHD